MNEKKELLQRTVRNMANFGGYLPFPEDSEEYEASKLDPRLHALVCATNAAYLDCVVHCRDVLKG
jgi:hypothetical protein